MSRLTAARSSVVLWPVLIALASSSARALDPEVPLAQMKVTRWGRDDGLPTDTVRRLARTPQGMILIGTEIGLVVFDGVTFTHHTVATQPGLPANSIEALLVHGDDVWIGTARGLAVWRDRTITALGDAEGVPATHIKELLVDRTGRLWILTAVGVFVRHHGAVQPIENERHEPRRPICSSGVELPDGSIALACTALRLWRDGRLAEPLIPEPRPTELALGPDGTLWFAADTGDIYRYTDGHAELVMSREDRVLMLHVDRHGALWVVGPGPGIQRRTADGRVEELLLPEGSRPAGARAIIEEPDGAMLFGTSEFGLVRVHDGATRILDRRSGGPTNVASVFVGRDGKVWLAGSSETALVAFDGARVERIASDVPVLTHLEEPDGTHWVGLPTGLGRVRAGAIEPEPLPVDSPVVFALARGREGALWIGTYSHGLLRRAAETALVKSADGRPLDVTALLIGKDERTLWVGTAKGVCRVPDMMAPTPIADCLDEARGGPPAMVLDMHEDRDGGLWLATFEGGLVRVRADGVAVLTERHGLPYANFYAILEDDAERFWISGPTGVVRLARRELDAVADGRSARVAPRFFGAADGLPVDETNGGSMTAARAPDGRLWFATPRGAVGIDPHAREPLRRSPPSVIEEVRVGARTLSLSGGTIEPGEGELVVRFTAPTLERARALRFRYRINGVEADWVDAGTRRVAVFTDLPPGRHDFRVQALAEGAADYGPEARLVIERSPAFSETAGFRLLVGAAFVLVLVLGHRWRVARILARKRELERVVGERTHELAEARDALAESNAGLERRVAEALMALRSAERMAAYGHAVASVAHEVRQPLFALGTTSFTLSQRLAERPDLAKIVSRLDRETKRLNRVMEELLDFAKPRGLALDWTPAAAVLNEAVEAFRAAHDPEAKLALDIVIDPTLPELRVDSARLQQVLVNLMHNAQKYARGMRSLGVRAERAGEDVVVVEVADDGQGIAPGDLERIFEPFFTTGGTGLGLAIARRIVEEHGGTITVSSSPEGTTFRITLPIGGPPGAP